MAGNRIALTGAPSFLTRPASRVGRPGLASPAYAPRITLDRASGAPELLTHSLADVCARLLGMALVQGRDQRHSALSTLSLRLLHDFPPLSPSLCRGSLHSPTSLGVGSLTPAMHRVRIHLPEFPSTTPAKESTRSHAELAPQRGERLEVMEGLRRRPSLQADRGRPCCSAAALGSRSSSCPGRFGARPEGPREF